MDKRGERTAVQAKCYADHNMVPVRTVRELVAAKRNHSCMLTLLVTTSDLMGPAKKEAEQFRVEYWHGGGEVEDMEEIDYMSSDNTSPKMKKKNPREILGVIALALVIALSLIAITVLLSHTDLSTNWYTNLGAVSTAVGVIVSSILLIVTILYLLATRDMVTEARRQREMQEEPAVSVRIVPDKDNFNILVVALKNTGGAPAYDVSVEFTQIFHTMMVELTIWIYLNRCPT